MGLQSNNIIEDSMNNLMSEQIDALAPALRKAKKVFLPVVKSKQAYGYKYADFTSCVEAIEEALYDNGLSFTQSVETEETGKVVVTVLLHDSGQWLRSKFPLESVAMKQCNAMQQIGAGVTYAKRYALCGMLGIATEDDDTQSLNKRKEEIKEKELPAATAVKEFMALCKDNSLDIKDFAKFAGVDSSKVETIVSAIENFHPLKETFLEVQNAAA